VRPIVSEVDVHLLDGTWELFRAYFGAPKKVVPDGGEVGAARALLRSLVGMLRDPSITHVAIAFDSQIESFRNELFDGYKSGEGIEPDLLAQFPLAERVAAALGIVVWPMREFEADDALATAAEHLAGQPGIGQVRLCTPDKDLAQCVRGRLVVQYDRRARTERDELGVIEKFGVAPAAIPAWLALVGDAADGIPGVPKWGAKSAATVLAHYGSLDAIPASAEDWQVKVRGAAALAASLAEHAEAVRLYERLTTLRRDVPLAEVELEALRWRGPDPEALQAVCDELDERVPRLPTVD
jgi:5'-3' exonuclease